MFLLAFLAIPAIAAESGTIKRTAVVPESCVKAFNSADPSVLSCAGEYKVNEVPPNIELVSLSAPGQCNPASGPWSEGNTSTTIDFGPGQYQALMNVSDGGIDLTIAAFTIPEVDYPCTAKFEVVSGVVMGLSSSSISATLPGYAIALIVIGSLVAVVGIGYAVRRRRWSSYASL